MTKSKYNLLLLVFSVVILSQACSRKAEGDEEKRAMIVGTWKARVKNTLSRDEYHIMEFTSDGRYRELTREGFGEDVDGWNSADTTGFKGFDLYIAYDDSVEYYIENSTVKFYSDKLTPTFFNFVPNNKKIEWIKPNKLKIENSERNDTYKYDKI